MAVIEEDREDELPSYEESKPESSAPKYQRLDPTSNPGTGSYSRLSMHLTADLSVGGPGASEVHLSSTYADDPMRTGYIRTSYHSPREQNSARARAVHADDPESRSKKLTEQLSMYVDGLPCLFFIFSIVILVGLTTKPAAWLILLATWSAVQTAVLFTGIFTMRTKGIRNFWDWFDKHRSWAWPLTLFVRLGVWAAIITLMFLAHPSCAHDSPFFLALVPSQPSSNISSRRTHQTPEQQGETKCVVSMVSLAGAFVMSLCYVGLLGIVFFRYARRSRAEGEYPLLSS